MKLTKLVAAPDRAYKVPPRARAAAAAAGTASQLIPGVRQTWRERRQANGMTRDELPSSGAPRVMGVEGPEE
jgi:hypothetical protein